MDWEPSFAYGTLEIRIHGSGSMATPIYAPAERGLLPCETAVLNDPAF